MKSMRKILLVLGMVACLATVTACGNANDVYETTVSPEEVEAMATGYVGLIDSVAKDTSADLEEVAAQVAQYGVDSEAFISAVENYQLALEELGDIKEVNEISSTEDDKTLTVNATIVGTKKTANVCITFNMPKMTFASMLTNVNYTLGEMMTTAGLNTLLGMGTVFCILILLMALISCFKLVNKAESAMTNKKDKVTTSVDKAVAMIDESEATQDDTELIAVIAAAIAASEGAASTDGYVVKSIRRRY